MQRVTKAGLIRAFSFGLVLGSLVLGGLVLNSPALAIDLSISESRVAIAEDSGSGVAVIGVERKISNYMNLVVRHAEVVQGDLVLDSDVAERSLWVAVDLGTGAWTVHSPLGPPREKHYAPEIRGAALRHIERLELPGNELDVVVVRQGRKGVSVWHGRLHDGGQGDESDSDGWLVGSVGDLSRLDSGSGKLNRLEDGDVVIGFDANTLESFAVEIGAAEEGGAS